MPLLVDTGILFALADRSDRWHARTRTYIESARETLLAPVTIVPEVAYLLRERISVRAELAFLRSIADGELAIQNIERGDWQRMKELMQAYDFLGLVDASVIAIAERFKVGTIATTDRRHFGAVRPAHIEKFALVP